MLLATIGFISAQEKSNAEFGFHIGPAVSLFYNQNPGVNPRKPNKPFYNTSAFGISGQYNFNKMVSMGGEINFERKGDVLYSSRTFTPIQEGQSFFTNSYAYNSIDYITLPVTCKLYFGKKVQFFTNLGLYAGFMMNANTVTKDATFNRDDQGTVTTMVTTTDISNNIRKVDGGLVTGLGVNISVWKTLALNFEARNNLGFASLSNNSETFPNKFYNNSTSFLFGFSVGLNKSSKTDKIKPQDEESKN
jgi:hypothetical protein